MTIEILLPALTPTMEEATVSRWLVSEGDKVVAGDVLVEIETDKTVVEMEAPDDGIILQILVPGGTEQVKVDSVIAVIGTEGETKHSPDQDVAEGSQKPKKAATDIKSAIDANTVIEAKADSTTRVLASPLARRAAAGAGIELAGITGTGANGRILEIDVHEFIEHSGTAAVTTPLLGQTSTSMENPADIPMEEVPLSNMRKLIARRLQISNQTVPHFYLTMDIDLGETLAARNELNASHEGAGVTVNDFIIRAVALTLMRVPDANVQFAGDKLIYFKRADISVVVAVDGGLVTPVIKGADTKSIIEISEEMRTLAQRARAGQLMPEEYQGGTFTISNLGMHGIKQFDAVINAPQACILAVGQCEERPVVRDSQVSVANIMTVTLSCDHRAIDGVVGSKFLVLVKELLQDHALMLVE